MIFYSGQYRSVWWPVTVLLMAMVIAGCAGMEPYEYRDDREEGPEKGLFTGSQGEWVIVGPEEPETDKKEEKDPDKPTKDKP